MSKKLSVIGLVAFASLYIVACSPKTSEYDSTGMFEATEVIVSAEAAGQLREFSVEEGMNYTANQQVGYVDSTQLYLRKKQLEAQIHAVLSRRPDIAKNVAALKEQLEMATREMKRLENLVHDNAATRKQLDDATSQVHIVSKQLDAQYSSLNNTTSSITSETVPLHVQVEQLEDQLRKCRIINPIEGTVLAKYAEQSELVAMGKPLYKIANVGTMTLRAYVPASSLTNVRIGKPASVFVNTGGEQPSKIAGTVTWISSKSEFTPKTIQTPDERQNLVYAVKIKVHNPGSLRIGMYADVKF